MNSEKKEFVMPAKNSLQIEEQMSGISAESGGEFVLPDYMPKVQRVLRLSACTTPPARYMSSKDAQFSGSVLHTLIYIGEDGEISATVLPSKYEVSVPFAASLTTPTVTAAVDVDSLTYRLSAPRKLNIRTRLRVKPQMFASADISEQAMADGDEIHKLYGEIDTVKTVLLNLPEITVSDSVKVSASENANLLWCGSNAAVTDVKPMDGGVSVRGEVVAKVLLDDGGAPKMYTKKIPFDEFIDGDIQKSASVIANAKVISTEASMANGEVLVDAAVSVDAIADHKEKISILKDVFSTVGEGSAQYQTLNSAELVFSQSGVYNVGASMPADGEFSIVDVSGDAVLDEIIPISGGIAAAGRCMLNLICQNEENGIFSSEYTAPFKIVLDCDVPSECKVMGNASLLNVRARTDSGNIVYDMDIALSARALASKEEKALSSFDCATLKPYAKNKYPLSIIYSGGESLWSLAKKYHVSPKTLAKVNMLDIAEADYTAPEKLDSVRALMLEFK